MRYDSREFYGNAMAALGALVAALMLVLCPTVARAAAAEYTILVDADGRTGTGCTVPTPKGPFAGVEFAIVTTVATGPSSAGVTGVARRNCVGGALGPAAPYDGSAWPVVFGQGGGVAAIETWAPLGAFVAGGSARLAVVSQGGGGSDAIVATEGGEAPRFELPASLGTGGSVPVPTLPAGTLALLAGLLAWLGARRALARALLRTSAAWTISAVLAAGVAGLAWAATVSLDGLTGDWNGIAPLGTDARGNAPANADLTAVYAQYDSVRVYFRIDADVVPDVPSGQLAPVVDAGPDQAIDLPSIATLSGSATDDGLPAPPSLAYAWSQVAGPASATLGTPASATTQVQFPQAGSYRFRLTVSDGALEGSDEVDVTVRPEANAAPTLAAPPDRTIEVGEPLAVRVAANDANAYDTLTFTLDAAPSGAGFSPAGSPILNWPGAASPSTHRFTVRVRDAAGAQDARSFDVHVVARNRAPLIAPQPDATLPTGGQFRRAVVATDPDGDAVTVELVDPPAGLALTGNLLEWSPTAALLGEHVVTLRASDGNGASAAARFAIRVVPGTVPLAKDDRYEVKLGATLDVAAPGVLANDADPDGEALSARRTSDPDKGTVETFGADGAFRYAAPPTLPPPPPLALATRWHADGGVFSLEMAIGDANGDGVTDVVHLAYNEKVRVLDGRDGSVVWALDGFPAPYDDCAPQFGGLNLPSIADIDDDGHPDIVIHAGCNRDWPSTGSLGHARMIALEGRTGAVKWLSPNLHGFTATPGNYGVAVAAGMTLSVARLAPGESPSVLGGYTSENFSILTECPRFPGAAAGDRRCRYVVALDGRDGSIRRTYYHAPAEQSAPAMGYARATQRFEAPIVADLGGSDGVAVIYEGSLWRADGTYLRSFDGTRARPNSSRVAVADLDADGALEIVTLDLMLGRARALHADGTVLWDAAAPHCRDRALGGWCALTIGDVDADGAPDVLLAGYDRIVVLDRYGRLKWARFFEGTQSQANPLGCDNRPAVYDLDGDGIPEVALRWERSVIMLEGTTGRELLRYPLGVQEDLGGGYQCAVIMEMRVADVDGDGAAELVTTAPYDGISGKNYGGVHVLASANAGYPWMPSRALFPQWAYRAHAIGDDLALPGTMPGAATGKDNHYAQQTQIATRPDLRERARTRFEYAAEAGGRASAPAGVVIDILPPNRPPAFTSVPPTAWAQTNFAYLLTATDPDAGDTIAFSIAHADDLAFETATTLGADNVLRKASSQPGAHLFIVRATDSQGAYAEQAFVVDVSNVTVAVPALIGSTQGVALATLAGASLVSGAIDELFDDTAPAGQVIGQSPGAGTGVPRGASVVMTVSKGPQPRLVPNVSGRALALASARLAASGFTLGAISWAYHDGVPAGDILEQTPAAGSEVVPGAVDVTVSGGTGLALALSREVLLAGGSLSASVRASAPDGSPQAAPPTTLSIHAIDTPEGPLPTLGGTTVSVGAATRGTFEVVATETGGAGRVARARFAVLDPGTPTEPPQQAHFVELADTLGLLGERAAALDAARLANDDDAMSSILEEMVALWTSRHPPRRLEDLSFSTPLAPSEGFLPPVASLPGYGFAPTLDDALLAPSIQELADRWAELRALLGEDPGSTVALRDALDALAAPTAAFARIEPSAYGVVDQRHEYKALLAREIPGALDRWFAAVGARLDELKSARGKAAGMREKFGLPLTLSEVAASTSIHATLAKKLYMPAIKHVAWCAGALVAAQALQSYLNTGALEGIITGASQSFHIFEAPYSTVEVLGMNPRQPQNAQVLFIGPTAIDAVTGLKDQIVAFGKKLTDPDPLKKMKNLNDLRKHVGDIRDALGKAIDQGFESYRVFDPTNFGADLGYRGCVLSQAGDCSSLVYKRGVMPVHVCTEGELCLPAPVIAIVSNTVDGGVGIAPFNFLPAFKSE